METLNIDVGFDEADLACTVVMLKAQVAAGVMDTPLAVELCPPGMDGPGWRRAAEEYLENALRRRQNGDARTMMRARAEPDYAAIADEMLHYDRRTKH